MRTKCSGGNPCDKCRKDKAACAFGDRKRERNKKYLFIYYTSAKCSTKLDTRELGESRLQVEDLKAKNNMLLQALKTLARNPRLDSNESDSIKEIILNVGSQYSLRGMTDCRCLV